MSEAAQHAVARKNGAAVLDTLGRQDAKITAQQQRIDALVQAVAALTERLAAAELALAVQRVKMMGHGPTA